MTLNSLDQKQPTIVDVAIVGAGIAALWAIVGIYLGRWFERENDSSM